MKDPRLCLQLSLLRSQILDHQQQFLIRFTFTQKPELEIEIHMTSPQMSAEATQVTMACGYPIQSNEF